jgi:hypothetical protein
LKVYTNRFCNTKFNLNTFISFADKIWVIQADITFPLCVHFILRMHRVIEFTQLRHSIWNQEDLLQQWKEFITALIKVTVVIMNCTVQNCIQHFTLKLNPIVDEITGDRQCRFLPTRSNC